MHDAPPPQMPGPPPGPADPNPGIAPEISRRVASILDAVEREADRLREEARAEAARYTAEARSYADGLVAERQRRIAEVSAEILSKSEAVVARLDDAAPVRQGFENLVRALGGAAERLAHETAIAGEEFAPPPFHDVGPAMPQQPAPPAPQQPPPAYQPPPPQQPTYQPPQQAPRQPAFRPPVQEPAQPPPDPYGVYEYPARSAQLGYAPETYPVPQAPQQPPARPQQQPPYGSYGNEADPLPRSGGEGGPPDQPLPHPARSPSTPGWEENPPQPQPPPAAPGWRDLDEAKMTAIQMATSGATRAGVREHLERARGIRDATNILDEIFGPGSRDDTRVPWAGGSR